MKILSEVEAGQPPLFLMDGTAFIYRSFYANQHLKRSDGFPTNALVLVTRLLLRILREEKPVYFLFAMDGKGKNFRHEEYEYYKANRQSMPEDLAIQIEPVQAMVNALGIPLHIASNYEADDCIASLAQRFQSERPVIILSGDKDLKQCLRSNVFMWDPAAKNEKLYTQEEFMAETGIPPQSWPDMQALIGDSTDNIPGVPGIGPKTAIQIFKECATLEDIKKHLDRLLPKIRAKLEPHLQEMFIWRRLTILKTSVCQDLSLEDLKIKEPDLNQCLSIAKTYEMASIAKEITEKIFISQTRSVTLTETGSNENPENINKIVSEKVLKKISNLSDLAKCENKNVAVIYSNDCEKNEQIKPKISVEDRQEFIWEGTQKELCEWLAHAKKIIVADLKPLIKNSVSWQILVSKAGIDRFFDISLAAYLLDPESGDYSFERIAAGWRETIGDIQGEAASFALNLFNILTQNLISNGLLELYETIEIPIILVLVAMEERGILIDRKAFQDFLSDVKTEAQNLSNAVFKEVGETFNIRSSQKLGEILFHKLGLTSLKKTKGGAPSTSQLALEKLADNPVVEKVLQFRKLDKMQSTYLEPFPRLLDSEGRIHTHFNQKVTATGRISSSNPNLQNIPVRGQLGSRMRRCFVAASGNLLVAADYSQIELRVLAHLSQDANLLKAFHNNEDIHASTASLVFEISQDQITPDQRRMAKTINFGLLYGMGARKLAAELKITEKAASEFITRYFSRLKGLKEFYEQILRDAENHGYVATMAGRRRWLPGISSSNGQIKAQAQRQAVNAVIQGSAADIIKIAMLGVKNDQLLKEQNAHILLQVHDELLLEAPEQFAQNAAKRVSEIMSNVQPGDAAFTVFLKVETGVGKNWGEAH